MNLEDVRLNTLYKSNNGIIIFFTSHPHSMSPSGISYSGIEISRNYVSFIKHYVIRDINSYSEDLSRIRIELKELYIIRLFGE